MAYEQRKQRRDALEREIRSRLDPKEEVLAVGGCNDISERGDTSSTGVGYTFVVVTDRKLRWIPHGDLRFEVALDFADVINAAEETVGHRYSIELSHRPLTRARPGPAHRFLKYAWGNAVVTTPLTRTRLGFSRRDTKAAVALRGQLANLLSPAE